MPKYSVYAIARATRDVMEEFVLDNFDPDWGCSCATCSWQLTRLLKHFGHNAVFAVGYFQDLKANWPYVSGHAFVTIGSEIVDITATQFNLDEVEIRRFDDPHYIVNYLGKSAVESLKKDDWPYEQRPYTYRSQLNKLFTKTINYINNKENIY